jgi:hypothetical protein
VHRGADVLSLDVDKSVTFDSIAGLDEQLHALKVRRLAKPCLSSPC